MKTPPKRPHRNQYDEETEIYYEDYRDDETDDHEAPEENGIHHDPDAFPYDDWYA